jgi:hypothetical protein
MFASSCGRVLSDLSKLWTAAASEDLSVNSEKVETVPSVTEQKDVEKKQNPSHDNQKL